VTFEQLQYFVEVYRQKSITKAANNLYVSRPVVSNMIKKLESEFNVTLFYRSATKIEPTPAGDDFYQYAMPLLTAEATLRQNMQKHSSTPQKEKNIHIGISDIIAAIYGNEISEKLSTVFPQYNFISFSVDFLTDTLMYSNCDIILANFSNTISDSDLLLNDNYVISHFMEHSFYAWISPDSPLNQYSILTEKHLKEYPNLVLKNAFNISRLLQEGTSKSVINIKITKSFIDCLENGWCYAFDAQLRHGNFIYADILKGRNLILKETNQRTQLDIIYRKTAKHFIPIIKSIIA